MKRVLFVYPDMSVGGSTTSLLAALASIDYSKYDVDLLLFNRSGALVSMLPANVRILSQSGSLQRRNLPGRARRALSPSYVATWLRASWLARKHRSRAVKAQILGQAIVRYLPIVEDRYDIAVAFLEFGPVSYVASSVEADSKVAWLHTDYAGCGALPDIEAQAFAKFERIVVVTPSCLESFNTVYPGLESRTVCIENIVTRESVLRRAAIGSSDPIERCIGGLEGTTVKIVSVSRVEFATKGLDRAVRAVKRIVDEGSVQIGFHWWIVGEGPDLPKLRRMISDLGLSDFISCCGGRTNPFPIMSQMDLFFLPSIYEGKPMAVTEAQMLGLPVLATDYLSAKQQVNHGFDGLVVENSEDGVYKGLMTVLRNPDVISRLRENVAVSEYGDRIVADAVNSLFAGLAGRSQAAGTSETEN